MPSDMTPEKEVPQITDEQAAMLGRGMFQAIRGAIEAGKFVDGENPDEQDAQCNAYIDAWMKQRHKIEQLTAENHRLRERIAELEESRDEALQLTESCSTLKQMAEACIRGADAESRLMDLESQHAGTEGPIPESELETGTEYVCRFIYNGSHCVARWVNSRLVTHPGGWHHSVDTCQPLRKLTPRAAAEGGEA